MLAISDKSHFVYFGLTGKILLLLRQNSATTNFIQTCINFTLLLTLLANTTLTTIKRDPIEVLPASSVNRAIFLCVCCISWCRTWYTPSITSLRVDFLALTLCACCSCVPTHFLKKNAQPKFPTFVCQNMFFKSAISRSGWTGTDAHLLPKNVTICLNVTGLSLTRLPVFIFA